MNFVATPIDGLWKVQATPRHDGRGSFTRLYDAECFAGVAPGFVVAQVNHSVTRRRGTVRGLHLQLDPAAEWKLVRCLCGAVFDVAADLRPESPTFGRWVGVEIDDRDTLGLLVPPGVAHGFQTLRDDVHLLYQHGAAHRPALEAGVRHDDPDLAIDWPLPVAMLSERDRGLPGLDAFRTALAA